MCFALKLHFSYFRFTFSSTCIILKKSTPSPLQSADFMVLPSDLKHETELKKHKHRFLLLPHRLTSETCPVFCFRDSSKLPNLCSTVDSCKINSLAELTVNTIQRPQVLLYFLYSHLTPQAVLEVSHCSVIAVTCHDDAILHQQSP